MTTIVQFPGLGLEFAVKRIMIQIGNFPIYWYGALIAFGMFLAILFAFSQLKEFGLQADPLVDVILIAFVGAIVCARAYYIIFSPFEYASFRDIISIRDGGLAIYGGLFGAVAFGILACKWRKLPVLPTLDLATLGFFIGQAVGRWGNFTNQEAFGTNTTLPWGMYSERTNAYLRSVQSTLAQSGVTVDPNLPVHPTFLYESLWCALGFLLLFLFMKKRRYDGQIAIMYAVWYGAGRMVIEALRTDSLQSGSIRVSQLVAAVSVVAGVALLLYFRNKKMPPLHKNTLAAAGEEIANGEVD